MKNVRTDKKGLRLLLKPLLEFFDKIAKVDDPVGAVSVHFANGVWGTIAVGLFSTGSNTCLLYTSSRWK